jgi:two-component system sensor histidine kinase EvgS
VRELALLRRMIARALFDTLVATLPQHGYLLGDLFDAATALTVRTYVEARDYEVRQQQAEHVGFVTHELRAPLTAAILATAALRHAPNERARERAVGTLERSHAALNELIDRVLLSERLSLGVQPRPMRMTVGELLAEPLRVAESGARAKGVGFHTRLDPDTALFIDPELARSAVSNILENAVKYTDEGRIDVDDRTFDAFWELHVRDTCVGLSVEELRTIFEPYHRGATRKPGSGLGLAIARRAVEAQGGSIGAESPAERGCHFWLRLPRA